MHLPEYPSDCDVRKIKATIRAARFAINAFAPWIQWGAILGMGVGVLLGMWSWWHHPLPPGRIWFALDPFAELFVWALGGVVIGCTLSALTYGLIQFLRPVYVALFRDAAQFEREYGSMQERMRKQH